MFHAAFFVFISYEKRIIKDEVIRPIKEEKHDLPHLLSQHTIC